MGFDRIVSNQPQYNMIWRVIELSAFAVMYTFLAINEIRLTATADEIEKFLLNLYVSGTFEFEHLCHWLRSNVTQ